MNYNVIKVEAKTVQKQGRNFGKKYVECTIVAIQKDEQGNEVAGEQRTVPLFDADAEAYLNCIASAKGGNAAQDSPIPARLAKWTYCFDQDYVFPEPRVRVNEQGQPELNKFNQMYVRKSVKVLTRYQMDEQIQLLNPSSSPLYPMRGWDIESRGLSVMNSFYIPLSAFNANAGGVQQIANQNAGGDAV